MLTLFKTFDDDGPVLLAMLGRGSQQDAAGNWVLTKLFEVCDEKGAHLAAAQPEDDNHPNSCIGGSEEIILAGVELWLRFRPTMTVFAYGERSRYLRDINAPSECEVGTGIFKEVMEGLGITPSVNMYDEAAWKNFSSGTDAEIRNIFTLAKRLGIKNVAILTVAVHVPRTALMIAGHLNDLEFSEQIFPQIYVAEQILERACPNEYAGLFAKSVGSKSFARTFEREIGFGGIYPRGGINAWFAGVKHTASSTVDTAVR